MEGGAGVAARDQIGGHVGQEAGGAVHLGYAVEGAAECVHQVEALLGAGDAHVGQAALLFQLVLAALRFVVQGALVGQYALVHADDEHDGVFQPLGGVEGDERYRVFLLSDGVGVGH